MLSLSAMLLFVVLFNVHTHDQHTGHSKARVAQNSRSSIIGQPANSDHTHCAACELYALGAGSALFVHAVWVGAVHIQEAIPVTANDLINFVDHNALASRAPPA